MKHVGLNRFDKPFFICALILVLSGFVMVLTSTFIYASESFADPYFFLKKHFAFALVGFAAMMSLSRYDYTKLQKWSFLLLVHCSMVITLIQY
jgi:cell division protein FtsW